jgi:hypothetical protein
MFNSNQQIGLNVYLRTNCPDPITFNKLYVRFNLASYNQYCTTECQSLLTLTPNQTHEFSFKFSPHAQDIGKELEINSISLELGKRENRVLVMHWKGDCKNALTHENHTIMSFVKISQPTKSKKDPLTDSTVTDWNLIKIIPITR